MDAYQEGYAAALIPPPDQPECPYAKGTEECDQWWAGYGDATDDYLYGDQ